jgi:hypothetical protein
MHASTYPRRPSEVDPPAPDSAIRRRPPLPVGASHNSWARVKVAGSVTLGATGSQLSSTMITARRFFWRFAAPVFGTTGPASPMPLWRSGPLETGVLHEPVGHGTRSPLRQLQARSVLLLDLHSDCLQGRARLARIVAWLLGAAMIPAAPRQAARSFPQVAQCGNTAKPRNVTGPIKFAQPSVYYHTATHVSATFPERGDRARDGSR